MDFYDLMGVPSGAPQEEIQRAFRRRVREYHPDRNDDPRAPAQFIALKKAYDTLGDQKERDAYDRLGHEEYVGERISGLPSVETWETPEDDGRVSRNASEVATGGTDTDTDTNTDAVESDWTSDADANPDTDVNGSADPDSDVDPEFDFDFDFDSDAVVDGPDPEANDAAGSTAGTTVAPDKSSTDGFVIDADSASSDLAGAQGSVGGSVQSVEVSKSPTASGAGTARGPKTAPKTDPESEAENEEPSIPEEYVDDETDEAPTPREWLRERVRRLFGWPLVGLANLVYLGALVAVYAANTDGIARLAEAVRTAGLPAALDSGYGITGPAALVGGALSGSTSPLVGGTVLLGLSLLASVYSLLVWWTRRNSHWDPSYLYAAGAAVPAVWTAVSSVGAGGGLAADLLAYVVVPVATMGAMVFFRILLPRGVRLVRQYRYRLLN